MQIKGKIPQRMVRRGVLGETYFDEGFKFMSEEVDPLSKQAAPSPPPHPDVLAGLAIPFPLAACVLRSCSRFFPAALCTGRCASERGFFLFPGGH